MNDTNHHSDSWDSCPKGALAQTIAQLKSRRRNRTLALSTGPVVVLLLILFVGVMFVQRRSTSGENHYGGISCSRVFELLAEYQQGNLEDTLAISIAEHLRKCLMCRTSYESMQDKTEKISQVQQSHQCGSCRHGHSVLISQSD